MCVAMPLVRSSAFRPSSACCLLCSAVATCTLLVLVSCIG